MVNDLSRVTQSVKDSCKFRPEHSGSRSWAFNHFTQGLYGIIFFCNMVIILCLLVHYTVYFTYFSHNNGELFNSH